MISPKLFKKELPSCLPLVLAGVGAILYLIQAIIYAHTTVSSLDEGSYLIKGMFYLNGVYKPFEPYGPLTNKAPFAFLIPGMAEYLFGAGLRQLRPQDRMQICGPPPGATGRTASSGERPGSTIPTNR